MKPCLNVHTRIVPACSGTSTTLAKRLLWPIAPMRASYSSMPMRPKLLIALARTTTTLILSSRMSQAIAPTLSSLSTMPVSGWLISLLIIPMSQLSSTAIFLAKILVVLLCLFSTVVRISAASFLIPSLKTNQTTEKSITIANPVASLVAFPRETSVRAYTLIIVLLMPITSHRGMNSDSDFHTQPSNSPTYRSTSPRQSTRAHTPSVKYNKADHKISGIMW